ncbi:MAG: YihA family ribosome biogenesis GTP-binding protein, partial [Bacteroidetes bacterium HGW-Bacteroidetes-21]
KPQKNDIEYINWLGEKAIPFSIVFTKTDKISGVELKKNIDLFRKKMLESWEECPPFFMSSAILSEGKEDILEYVENILKNSP